MPATLKPVTEAEIAEMLRLRQEGLTLLAIGRRLGRPKVTVYRRLRRLVVPPVRKVRVLTRRCKGGCGTIRLTSGYCESCLALIRQMTAIHNEDGVEPRAFKEFKRPNVDAYAARVAAGQRIFE